MNSHSYNILKAGSGHAEMISAIAFRSKAHWGYSDSFMQAAREELTYSKQEIEDNYCYYLHQGNLMVGFYILKTINKDECELDALYIEPTFIGNGLGRNLIEHAKTIAIETGAKKLIIQGDPNAENFYLAIGAIQIGIKESGSISGRYLPLFEIKLN